MESRITLYRLRLQVEQERRLPDFDHTGRRIVRSPDCPPRATAAMHPKLGRLIITGMEAADR